MSTDQVAFDFKAVSIFDKKNPHSLLNMVPATLRQRIGELDKRWFTYSPRILKSKCHPNATEEQLRIAFWHEYASAQERNVSMRMDNVYGPVCTKDFFYRVIMKSDSKVAWLVSPPAEYQIQVEEMLHLGLTRIREVLSLPLLKKGTREPDHRLIGEMVKIVALLDNRVKGSVIQRMAIQQQNTNINISGSDKREVPRNISEINYELKEVEREIEKIEAPQKSKMLKEFGVEGRGTEPEVIEVATAEAEASSGEA